MAKRIQMRKNRFLAIQKIAEQKKLNVDGGPDDHMPKQTVSNRTIGLSLKFLLTLFSLPNLITKMKKTLADCDKLLNTLAEPNSISQDIV